MKRKDIYLLVAVAFVTGIISLMLAGLLFNSPRTRSKVPAVETLPTSLPDVKNDPNYSSFLNEGALDPTQPVQIGSTQNDRPFNTP